MESVNLVLPVLLYTFGIILLIVLIILGIRFILILNKLERVVDNIDGKVNSLNGLFSIIDKATDSIAIFSDSIVNTVAGLVFKIFKRKKRKDEDDYE